MKIIALKESKTKQTVYVNVATIERIESAGSGCMLLHFVSGDAVFFQGDPSLIVREIESRSKQDGS